MAAEGVCENDGDIVSVIEYFLFGNEAEKRHVPFSEAENLSCMNQNLRVNVGFPKNLLPDEWPSLDGKFCFFQLDP